MLSERYKDCIEACLECVKACDHCASEDLKEAHNMSHCIRLNLECSAICAVTAKLMSLESEQALALAKLCAELCKKCEKECSRHDNLHCKKCAEACHKCSLLCTTL